MLLFLLFNIPRTTFTTIGGIPPTQKSQNFFGTKFFLEPKIFWVVLSFVICIKYKMFIGYNKRISGFDDSSENVTRPPGA